MQEPPEGMEPGQRPDGNPGGQRPNMGGNPDGSTGATGTAGATCSYESVFTLSNQVNAFSGVVDYGHSLTKIQGQEGYICSGCGRVFADEAGTTELVQNNDSTAPAADSDNTLLIIVLIFVGVALIGASVTAIVLAKKKK